MNGPFHYSINNYRKQIFKIFRKSFPKIFKNLGIKVVFKTKHTLQSLLENPKDQMKSMMVVANKLSEHTMAIWVQYRESWACCSLHGNRKLLQTLVVLVQLLVRLNKTFFRKVFSCFSLKNYHFLFSSTTMLLTRRLGRRTNRFSVITNIFNHISGIWIQIDSVAAVLCYRSKSLATLLKPGIHTGAVLSSVLAGQVDKYSSTPNFIPPQPSVNSYLVSGGVGFLRSCLVASRFFERGWKGFFVHSAQKGKSENHKRLIIFLILAIM